MPIADISSVAIRPALIAMPGVGINKVATGSLPPMERLLLVHMRAILVRVKNSCKTEINMRDTGMSTDLYRAARRLRLALWTGVVLTPVLTAAGLVGAWQGESGPGGTTLKTGGLPLEWASALAITQSLLVATALHQLAVLLGEIRLEQLFPPQASRRFGRFAAMLFVAVLVHGPLSTLLAALLDPGNHPRGIFLDLADLAALLVTSVFWMVARLLDTASRLEKEHHSIV